MKKSPSVAVIKAICDIHYIYQIINQALEYTLILIINILNVLDTLFTSEFSKQSKNINYLKSEVN